MFCGLHFHILETVCGRVKVVARTEKKSLCLHMLSNNRETFPGCLCISD